MPCHWAHVVPFSLLPILVFNFASLQIYLISYGLVEDYPKELTHQQLFSPLLILSGGFQRGRGHASDPFSREGR